MAAKCARFTVVLLAACWPGLAGAQTIVTVAGGGRGDGLPATSVAMPGPIDVALGPNGDLFIADSKDCVVFRVSHATRRLAIIAGTGECAYGGDGGPATAAALAGPTGLAVDRAGNVFISETGNHRVRRVDARTGRIETIAGTGTADFSGDAGPAVSAALNEPAGLAFDLPGSLYIADTSNNRIRRVDGSGRIQTIVGPDVPGLDEELDSPSDAAVDAGGRIYIADTGNRRVILFDPATRRGRVVVAADGRTVTHLSRDPLRTMLGEPVSVAVGPDGVYISDTKDWVWVLDRAGRMKPPPYWPVDSRIAPPRDGQLEVGATPSHATGLAVAPNGDLYIADPDDHRVCKVARRSRVLTTYAGNGTGAATGDGEIATLARLTSPSSVAVDRAGALYVADAGAGRVRKIDPIDGTILTVIGSEADDRSGTGGPSSMGSMATGLDRPGGVAVDPRGNVAVSDTGHARLRLLNASTADVTTIAGRPRQSAGFGGDGGPPRAARLDDPQGLAFDSAGHLYIADQGNSRLRRIDAAAGVITSVAGEAAVPSSPGGGPPATATGLAPGFYRLQGVAVDSADNVYVAETWAHRIRRVDAKTGQVTTVAGNGRAGYSGDGGPAQEASLSVPRAVAVDAAGNVYIADCENHRVRRVDTVTGIISTVAGTGEAGFSGDGGPAAAARLDHPASVAVGRDGTLYVADIGNNRVRAILPPGGPASPWLRHLLHVPLAHAVPAPLVPLARTCELLTRRLPMYEREGEMRLGYHEHEYVTLALEELRTQDAARQVRAARWLKLMLSPLARMELRGVQGIARPVDRPALHPEAARVRVAAFRALTELLAASPHAPVGRLDDPLVAVAELVAEVGNDDTARAIDALLRRPGTERHWPSLTAVIRRIHGLPWRFELTNQQDRRLNSDDLARERADLRQFLQWHATLLASSSQERMRWAVADCEGMLSSASGYFTSDAERAFLAAVRLGTAAVPSLRRMGARSWDASRRPMYHVAIAGVTGCVDHDLVVDLLNGDEEEIGYGLALIKWSGSRAFRDDLVRLLRRDEPYVQEGPLREAATVLATVHLGDALPILRAARDRLKAAFKPCPWAETLQQLEDAFKNGEW